MRYELKKGLVLVLILLFISGCSTNNSDQKYEETISGLKQSLKEYSDEVEQLTNENHNLLERFTKECVDGKDHLFGSGGVVAETIVPSIVDGADYFAYTFRGFQTNYVYACSSKEKLVYDKGELYSFECDEKREIVSFKLFDE